MVERLQRELKEIKAEDLYELEPDIFAVLTDIYEEKPEEWIAAYLTVSNWFNTSEGEGVWQFYELMDKEMFETAIVFLKSRGKDELVEMMERGNHDYQNPIYQEDEDLDYPEEWLDESDEIDDWVTDHEDELFQFEYDLLTEFFYDL